MPTSNVPGHLDTLKLLMQYEASAEVQVAETGTPPTVTVAPAKSWPMQVVSRPYACRNIPRETPRSRNADPGLHPPIGMLQHVTVQEPVSRVVCHKGDFG